MAKKSRRTSTRTQVWSDTEAIITAADPMAPSGRAKIRVQGGVRDIGSFGMFFVTQEYLPRNVEVEIEILFDPNSRLSKLSVKARGNTVHRTPEGIGIKFSEIDLSRLQRCIIEKMNRQERLSQSMYTVSESDSATGGKKN